MGKALAARRRSTPRKRRPLEVSFRIFHSPISIVLVIPMLNSPSIERKPVCVWVDVVQGAEPMQTMTGNKDTKQYQSGRRDALNIIVASFMCGSSQDTGTARVISSSDGLFNSAP